MNMKFANAATFLLIAAFMFLYYGMVYFQLPFPIARGIFFGGGIILCIGLLSQRQVKNRKRAFVRRFGVISATLAGGLAAFYLSGLDAGFGIIGPVIAASAVGLAGFEILRKLGKGELAPPMYCGTFIGMSSHAFFSIEMIAAAGLVSAAVYILASDLYTGSGGKLGTIAFIGTAIVRKMGELLF
ncbi:MAG: hypothetical protein KKB25_02115 [Nanoarchaeota archaeon]|nr:hypothetical protein [Nanoarchaeota archaeon]